MRQWIYVKYHCEKLFNVLRFGRSGEIYNLAPDYESEHSNLEIVKSILSELNASENLISYVEDRKGHDLRYS